MAKSCISGSRNEGLLSLRCPDSWSIHIQQAHLMSDCDSDLACCVKGSYSIPVDDFPGININPLPPDHDNSRFYSITSKHRAFSQCCFNVGPASETVGQH